MDMIGRIRAAAREGQPVGARERTCDSAVAQHGFEVLRVLALQFRYPASAAATRVLARALALPAQHLPS
jgi:hypothetical protein